MLARLEHTLSLSFAIVTLAATAWGQSLPDGLVDPWQPGQAELLDPWADRPERLAFARSDEPLDPWRHTPSPAMAKDEIVDPWKRAAQTTRQAVAPASNDEIIDPWRGPGHRVPTAAFPPVDEHLPASRH